MSTNTTRAFPVPMIPWNDGFTDVESPGMTLRDYRATHILAGMLANPQLVGLVGIENRIQVYRLDNGDSRLALCHRAYMIADDMVKAAEIPQVKK